MKEPANEADLIARVFDCFDALRRMGWRDAFYAPRDGISLEVIEAGSSGIHKATRDANGRFWISDNYDVWPSRPILFRVASGTGTPATTIRRDCALCALGEEHKHEAVQP